jgi:hypothetical protein
MLSQCLRKKNIGGQSDKLKKSALNPSARFASGLVFTNLHELIKKQQPT